MQTNAELAELIIPERCPSIEELEKRFPLRNTSGEVTRFAPSPTGFLHLGSLFTALIARKIAFDTHGLFYVRLEDTDSRREVQGSGPKLIKELARYGIVPDEGYLGDHEVGAYGPYCQSRRASIYRAVIKELLKKGLAYPCFCSAAELAAIRSIQEKSKVLPGYYGEYARCRNLTVKEASDRIRAGEPYVVRFRSHGSHLRKVRIDDVARGRIDIAENDLDVVIMKSDGLPTYHFAHVVDDHFMRTTLVLRGEEWIASAPIHKELFEALGFKPPRYAHLPVIMKAEDGRRRKLSKRTDPEAAVAHFAAAGYPAEVLSTYLMSIANSDFEEWTRTNDSYDLNAFTFRFAKLPLDGVLFDEGKLNYFGREIIARMSAKEVYERLLTWSKENDQIFHGCLVKYPDLSLKALGIERGILKARKDYACWRDVFPHLSFFYNEEFARIIKDGYPFPTAFPPALVIDVLKDFLATNDFSAPAETWFSGVKELGLRHGFAARGKDLKAEPTKYRGHVGDVAAMLRVALVGATVSPDLHGVIEALGQAETRRRIELAVASLLRKVL